MPEGLTAIQSLEVGPLPRIALPRPPPSPRNRDHVTRGGVFARFMFRLV